MRNRIAKAAVIFAMAGTFAAGAGAAFAGNPGFDPTGKVGKQGTEVELPAKVKDKAENPPKEDPKPGGDATTDEAEEGSKVVNKGDYPYEVPGDDGKYKLDKKMCWDALKHPQPPHQDGDRWSYWNACHDKYGDYHEPTKKHETTTYKTYAPSVHVSPTFAG